MPIGSTNVYNPGDLILSTVSGSGTSFIETKIIAATSSFILFNSSGTLTSASLNSIVATTSSYVSGSTSIITNLTASNISASGNISASLFVGSHSGSTFGTSSWASNALTASYISPSGNAFVQGGNSFGTTAVLGTNDAQPLALETNGTTRMSINSNGNVAINTSTNELVRLNISDTHRGSLGSSSLYIETIQNQNQGLATSANDSGINNVYYVNNFTSSTAIQNQAIYNQLYINGSGSFSGSYRASRNAILISNTASLDSNGAIINTYLTNQITANIPTFNIPNWYAGTYTAIDIITGNSTGSINNLYNHYINPPFSSGGVGGITVNNSYGVYINKQKTTNIVTNGWGIYQADTDDLNILAGKTRIGSTTVPVNALDVTGNISASAYTGSSAIITNITASNISASGTLSASNVWFNNSMVYTETMTTGSLTTPDITFTSTATTGSDVMMRIDTTVSTGSSIALQINASGSQTSYAISASNGIIAGTNYIATNITASNISVSSTGSFGIVGIGTASPAAKLDVSANAVDIAIFRSSGGLANDKRLTITSGGEKVIFNVSDNSNTAIARAYEFQNAGTASMTLNSTGSLQVVNTGRIIGVLRAQSTPQTTFYDNTFAVNSDGGGAQGFIYTSGTGGTFPLDFYGELIIQAGPRTGYNNGISLVTGTTSPSVKLRVAENGNVGIGTTTPGALLEISSSTAASLLNVKGAGGNGILFVSGSGNVGIGTTSPAELLDIAASADNSAIAGPKVNFKKGATTKATIGIGGNYLGQAANTDDLIFRNDAGNILFGFSGAEKMRIASGGNIGIGTTSPGALLEISSSTAASLLNVKGAGGNGILFVSGSGNVGIGTSSPTAKLQVIAGNSPAISILSNNAGQYAYQYIGRTASELELGIAGSANHFFTGTVAGDAVIKQNSTGKLHLGYGSAAPSITINSSNNVGIGTTSPASKLHISGSGQTIMRLDSDTTSSVSQFQIKAASDAVLIMGMLGGSAASTNFGVTAAGQAYFGTTTLGSPHPTSLVIGNASNIPIIFSTNNVERMRIDDVGNVGIGTTTTPLKLNVSGSIYMAGGNGSAISWASDISSQFLKYDSVTDGMILSSWNNTTFLTQQIERVRIASNGNVGIGTTSPGARLEISSSTAASLLNVKGAGGNGILFVSGSGNVGIGTTSPGEKLTVSGSSYIIGGTGAVGTGTAYYLGDSSNKDISLTRVGTAALAIGRYYPSAWAETIRFTADGYVVINNSTQFTTGGNAQLSISTNTTAVALSFGASNTDMSYIRRLSSAVYQWQTINGGNDGEIHLQPYGGNVGIGITNPTAKLHVSGSSIITNPNPAANSAVLLVQDEGTATTVTSGTTLRVVNNGSAANFSVFEASSAVSNFVILNNGNVGIGVTNPLGKLHITGSTTASENLLYLSKGSGSIVQHYINAVNQSGQLNYRLTSDINGHSQQTLYHNGTAYVYNDSFWSSWINNNNYTQGGLGIGTTSLTHGYGVTIARPATSGSLYVSGSSVFTGSVNISGSVTFSGPIIYDNAVLLDYGIVSTPVVSTNYVVLQNLTGSYNSAFFDYFASSGSNFRAGTVIAGWSGNNVNYTEYSTTDVGNTNQLSMSVDLSGSFVRLLTTVSTTINWNIKTAGRYL